MAKYVIIKEYMAGSYQVWRAYHAGFFARLIGVRSFFNYISGTTTCNGAVDCQRLLRNALNSKRSVVVQELEL